MSALSASIARFLARTSLGSLKENRKIAIILRKNRGYVAKIYSRRNYVNSHDTIVLVRRSSWLQVLATRLSSASPRRNDMEYAKLRSSEEIDLHNLQMFIENLLICTIKILILNVFL